MSEEMFKEAVQAVKGGQRQRAKDLFGRLLKTEPKNVEYWIWMSSVVETEKEQIFCLQQAAKIDPNAMAARQGLVILGAMTPEEAALPPPQPIEAAPVVIPQMEGQGGLKEWLARPRNRQIAMIGGLGALAVVILGVIFFTLVAPRIFRPRQVVVVTSTATVTNTAVPPTATEEVIATSTPTLVPCSLPPAVNPATPIAAYLCITQTPMPFPVPTERALSEDYNSMVKAFTNGEWDRVLARADVVTRDPTFGESAKVYFYIAEAYRHTNKLSDALQNYRTALTKDASFAAAYWGRAQVEFQQKKQTDALADIDAAIEADPGFYLAYLDRAAYLGVAIGSHARALADLQLAQSGAADNPLVLAHLAVSYMDNQMPDEALATAEQALALDPGQPLAYYARGRAHYALGDMQAADQDLSLAAAYLLDPQTFSELQPVVSVLNFTKYYQAQVLYHTGRASAGVGDDETALKQFTQALGLYNNLTVALVERGNVYLRLEKYDDARTDFNTAIGKFQESDANNPALTRAYFGNGLALLALNRAEGAASNFQVVVRAEPENFEAYVYLGVAFTQAGQGENALPAFETALTLAQTTDQQARVYYARSLAFQSLKRVADEIGDLILLASIPDAPEGLAPTAVARLTAIGPLPTATPTGPTPTPTKPTATPTAGPTSAATRTNTPGAGRTPTPTPTKAAARPSATSATQAYPAPSGATTSTSTRTPTSAAATQAYPAPAGTATP